MFHSYKYEFLKLIRQKEMIFWSVAFPIILGSLIFFANGGGDLLAFYSIPVGVVVEDTSPLGESFQDLMGDLSSGDEPLLNPTFMTMANAREQLESGDLEGIYHVTSEEVKLIVSNNGINQNILRQISSRFVQIFSTLDHIAMIDENLLAQGMDDLLTERQINDPISLGPGNMNLVHYIMFTVLAMACFMGATSGLFQVHHIQGNQSDLAARRSIAPTQKLKMILPQFFAGVTVQFAFALVAFLYLRFALQIDFGERVDLLLLALLVGCFVSLGFGIFFGAITQNIKSVKTRESLLTGAMMVMMVFSGMMSPVIRTFIRQHEPLVDRLSPFTLLVDGFHSLNAFDGYEHFVGLMMQMMLYTALFCLISAALLRRKSYDSV